MYFQHWPSSSHCFSEIRFSLFILLHIVRNIQFPLNNVVAALMKKSLGINASIIALAALQLYRSLCSTITNTQPCDGTCCWSLGPQHFTMEKEILGANITMESFHFNFATVFCSFNNGLPTTIAQPAVSPVLKSTMLPSCGQM